MYEYVILKQYGRNVEIKYVESLTRSHGRKTVSERKFLRLRQRKSNAFSLNVRAEHSLIFGRRHRVYGRSYVINMLHSAVRYAHF